MILLFAIYLWTLEDKVLLQILEKSHLFYWNVLKFIRNKLKSDYMVDSYSFVFGLIGLYCYSF